MTGPMPTQVAVSLPQSAAEHTAPATDKVLPLPGWLVKVYFIFPVILYIPDAIFNYYVYSDGWNTADASPLVQIGKVALVSFLSIGVVGMAYLLSVLAPWHWGQGHHVQSFFCAIGVVIATAITIWNSLAYRSASFVEFKTDQWAYNLWPDLQLQHVSITMILVSIAPPFWGLFWAIVQPTETGRSLRQLQESHAERLLRVQHEAEVKRLKAETNATVREAQLRGMAKTAAAARVQAGEVLRRKKAADEATTSLPQASVTITEAPIPFEIADETESSSDESMTRPIPALPKPRSSTRTARKRTNSDTLKPTASDDDEGARQQTGSFLRPLSANDSGSRHAAAASTSRGDRKRGREQIAQRLASWTQTDDTDETSAEDTPQSIRAVSSS